MAQFKPDKKFFTIILGVLVVVLLVFGALRWKFGQFLPEVIDKNLPDAVIVAAVGVMLWNRQILNQEKKEALAKQAAEEAADAEREDAEGEGDDTPPSEKPGKADSD